MASSKIAIGSLLQGLAPGVQAFAQQRLALRLREEERRQKNLEAQSGLAAEATKSLNTAQALMGSLGLGAQTNRLVDTTTPAVSGVGVSPTVPGVEVSGDITRSLETQSEERRLSRQILSNTATMLAGGIPSTQVLKVMQPRIEDLILRKTDPYYRELAKRIPDITLRLETYRSDTSELGKVAQIQQGLASGMLESVGGDPGAFTFDELARFSALSNDPKIAAEAIDRWSNVGEVKALSAVNADILAVFGNPATARDSRAQLAVQGQSVELLVGAGFGLSEARQYVKQEFDVIQSGNAGQSEAWKLAKAPEVARWKSSTGGALAPFYNHARKILANQLTLVADPPKALDPKIPGVVTVDVGGDRVAGLPSARLRTLEKDKAAIRKAMIERGPSSDVAAKVTGAVLREEGLIEGGQQFLVWADYVDWFLDVADKDGNIRPDRIATRLFKNNKFWNQTFSDVALIQSGQVTTEDLSAVSPEASLEALVGLTGAE